MSGARQERCQRLWRIDACTYEVYACMVSYRWCKLSQASLAFWSPTSVKFFECMLVVMDKHQNDEIRELCAMQFPNIPIQQILGLVTRGTMSNAANKAFTSQVLHSLIAYSSIFFTSSIPPLAQSYCSHLWKYVQNLDLYNMFMRYSKFRSKQVDHFANDRKLSSLRLAQAWTCFVSIILCSLTT